MKVMVKTDRVPIVIMLIGAAFVIVASLSDHAADEESKKILMPVGFIILISGFFLWAIPSILKYQKKKRKVSSKRMRPPEDDQSRPQRYARPRR
ncbi:MAG: hypothetical protein ACMUHB_07645 [Thermoplasmatota archaeon]